VVIGGDGRINDTGLGVGCRVWNEANVIQELCRGGAGVLKIPRLIELCMMAMLDDAGVNRLTAIRVLARSKNSRPVGFLQ